MENKLKKVLNNTLEDLAINIVAKSGCVWLWGEVEVPECLRKELVENQEQE